MTPSELRRAAELLRSTGSRAWDLYTSNVAQDRYNEMLALAAKLEAMAEAPEHSELIAEVVTTMEHARVFITSREKMHPAGVELWDQLLHSCRTALEFYAHASTADSLVAAPSQEGVGQGEHGHLDPLKLKGYFWGLI